MTGKKIVQELRSQGHKVDFYKRKDGGIRITNIDGVKFSSRESLGNAYGAQLLGVQGSQKAYQQRIAAGQSAKQLSQTSKSFQKAFHEAQKAARTGKNPVKISWKDTKATFAKRGEKGTIEILKDIARHAQGLAYESHFEVISNYLDKMKSKNPKFGEYNDKIQELKDVLPVEIVDRLINVLYSYQSGAISENIVLLVIEKIINNPEFQEKFIKLKKRKKEKEGDSK